ncbi:MAG: DUF6504 family protein [Nitriliruptoraceae bacterium]
MTKRYREHLEEVEVARARTAAGEVDAPVAFRWRGQHYRVLAVLGHWHEDEGWWRRGEGLPERIERTDLWRVEARNGVPTRGVYELVHRGAQWRLDRVWD